MIILSFTGEYSMKFLDHLALSRKHLLLTFSDYLKHDCKGLQEKNRLAIAVVYIVKNAYRLACIHYSQSQKV
jgi:hypothetical protein